MIITAATVFSLGLHFAFADSNNTSGGITVAQPPIIPGGSNSLGSSPTTGSPSAQDIINTTLRLPGVGTDNPAALQQSVLPTITNLVIQLTGGLALLFVIISGVQILTAYGNEEKIGAAKKTLTWALAGLAIAILSYAIVQIIVSIQILPAPPKT